MIYVLLIGNRDIQFNEKQAEKVKSELNINLNKNTENNGYYCFDKKSLYKNSKTFLKNIEHFDFETPLINPIIKETKEEDEIILLATNQPKPFKQDTYYVAKAIKYALKRKNVEATIKEIEFNPNHIKEYEALLEELFLKKDKYIVEVSGGVPTTKMAIYLYSFISEKDITLVDVDSEGKVCSDNFEHFAYSLLKSRLIKALEQYDYSFIKSFLEKTPKEFQNTFSKAYRLYSFKENFEEKEIIKQYKKKLGVLLSLILIHLRKEEYNYFLGETFAYLQNIGYYIILLIAKDKNRLVAPQQPNSKWKIQYHSFEENKTKKDKINDVFDNNFGKFLFLDYPEIVNTENQHLKLKDTEVNIDKANNYAIHKVLEKLKDCFGKDLKGIIDSYIEHFSFLKRLSNLRNQCIVSHKLMGYDLKDIKKKLNVDSYEEIESRLIQMHESIVKEDFTNVFDEYNRKLRELL
jgi:hypothetical protein